jgi:hypothetical protein
MRIAPWGLLGFTIVCCRDAVAPGNGPPGLTIVAGDNVRDTAMTVLPQALIVEVGDPSGLSTGEVMTLPYSASMLDPVFRP